VNFLVEMELSGKTKAVILIGNPVEHSMSPKMHTIAFKNVGIDAIYIAAKVDSSLHFVSIRMTNSGRCTSFLIPILLFFL